MKKLKTRKRNISWGIKDEDGNILTSREEKILERWAKFYEELYDDPNNCEPLPTNNELSIPPITKNQKSSQPLIDCHRGKALASTTFIPSSSKLAEMTWFVSSIHCLIVF